MSTRASAPAKAIQCRGRATWALRPRRPTTAPRETTPRPRSTALAATPGTSGRRDTRCACGAVSIYRVNRSALRAAATTMSTSLGTSAVPGDRADMVARRILTLSQSLNVGWLRRRTAVCMQLEMTARIDAAPRDAYRLALAPHPRQFRGLAASTNCLRQRAITPVASGVDAT